MSNEVMTRNSEWMNHIVNHLNRMVDNFERAVMNYRPMLDGERFMTDKELCARLQLSRRTLQDYRNNGVIPYIQLGGKILYRESDIQKILMANYREAYRMYNPQNEMFLNIKQNVTFPKTKCSFSRVFFTSKTSKNNCRKLWLSHRKLLPLYSYIGVFCTNINACHKAKPPFFSKKIDRLRRFSVLRWKGVGTSLQRPSSLFRFRLRGFA